MKKSRSLLIYWLVALPVGWIALTLIGLVFGPHRYSDAGFGSFHGAVNASMLSSSSDWHFSFQGRSEPQWRYRKPSNYRYPTLNVEWFSTKEANDGSGILETTTMTLVDSNGRNQLSETRLFEILRDGDPPDDSQEIPADISELYSMLVAAGNGSLPQPRHHPRYLEGNLEGNMNHFSLGSRYSHWTPVWGVIWLATGGLILFRRNARKREAH